MLGYLAVLAVGLPTSLGYLGALAVGMPPSMSCLETSVGCMATSVASLTVAEETEIESSAEQNLAVLGAAETEREGRHGEDATLTRGW